VYLPIDSLSEGGSMPGTLTKADLISVIQTENGYSLKKSTDIVETLLEIIKSNLESGEDVLVSGFGKFQVKDKRVRRGRNPATGNDMILPARRVVTFKCAGKLRDRINKG
jgi:integration host factor subunit alpha